MTTLKQIYWENCDKLIKCDFPCNSCFGYENKLKEVKEWLQQKRHENYPCNCSACIQIDGLLKELNND